MLCDSTCFPGRDACATNGIEEGGFTVIDVTLVTTGGRGARSSSSSSSNATPRSRTVSSMLFTKQELAVS